MAMTLSQKILCYKAGLKEVFPSQLVTAKIDVVLGNDITSPVAIAEFKKAGFKKVFDPNKVCLVMDHFVPNKDIKSAEQCKTCRSFAYEQGLPNFFDVGKMGIEHALLPEQGIVTSGELIIGADSHTCTYGALGAFSTGVGSSDMAYALGTGELWFKVPSAIKVELVGKPNKNICGKDIILYLIGKIGVDGARYKSLEFTGDGIKYLNIDDRFTICNMAIEAGAKNGIFAPDEVSRQYLSEHSKKPAIEFFADEDAVYDEVVTIELSKLRPIVSFPHLPSNTRFVDEIDEVKIDQVVIGSCTNGHISDLRAAADVLKNNKVAKNVRTIIIPATNEIYLQALREGLIEIFIRSGAVVSTPTCGPCLGGYMGILAKGERCVATTNRNFIGRMGDTESEVYLSSPYIAACSAVLGKVGELI